MVPTSLAHYRILRPLGAGGMGEVFVADDTKLGRQVALKVLAQALAGDPERRLRFEREARAVAALNHPNIITIYSVEEQAGCLFLTMELVEGAQLGEVIPPDGLSLAQWLQLAIPLADAVGAAHQRGITHRDLKPANVMVGHDGRVKVLDFGLAKVRDASVVDGLSTVTREQLTSEGRIVGTVAYMSPEQAQGKPVDARSDVFSLGILLFEMATGERPFKGDTNVSLLSAILKDTPASVTTLRQDLPRDVGKILKRCLAKDPDERYQTAKDLRNDLRSLKEDIDTGAVGRDPTSTPASTTAVLPPAPVARGVRPGLALTLAAGAVLAVVGGVLYTRRPVAMPAPPRTIGLTTFPGAELYPSLSPDGNHVAFTWTGPKQGRPDVYVQMIGSGVPLRLTTTDSSNEFSPVWSPDGRWIAFLRAERSPPLSAPAGTAELRLIPALGGPERLLAHVSFRTVVGTPAFIAWCPDSTCVVVTDSPDEDQPDALFVVSVETGERRQLTHPAHPLLGDCNPAIAPDGGSLVFRRVPAGSAGELHHLALRQGVTADGEPRRLTLGQLNAAYPAWTPDSKAVIFSAKGHLWRLAADAQSTDAPTELPFTGEDGTMPVVSRPLPGRAARLAYARSFQDSNIWRFDAPAAGLPSSSPPVAVVSSTKEDINPDLSPDGHRVTFASNRSGSMEVWVAETNGGDAVQLTSMGAQTTTPRWSQDGQLIAFQSNREGQFDIYVVPGTGGRPHNLTSHPANDHAPSFSRDGQWVYFSSTRTGNYRIWKIPVRGGEAVQVTDAGFRAIEGTDGKDIYYSVGTLGDTATLWRTSTVGGPAVKVLNGVVHDAFAIIDTGIYFVDRDGSEARLQYYDFVTRRSVTVTRGLGDIRPFITASPEGRVILVSRVDSALQDLMLVENFR